MIEELLLALCGYSSPFFDHKNEEYLNEFPSSSLKLNYSSQQLHPGEIELLDRLLQLGVYCNMFRKFVDRYGVISHVKRALSQKIESNDEQNNSGIPVRESCEISHGFYVAAFAEGLNAILTDYCRHLCSLETEFATDDGGDDARRNLFYLNSELQTYFLTFSAIDACINRFVDQNLKGSQLISVINDSLQSGVPTADAELGKIRRSCGAVFANHLTEFLTRGHVIDEFNEFFINRNRYTDDSLGRLTVRHDFKPPFISDFLLEKISFIGDKVILLKDEVECIVKEEEISNVFAQCCAEVREIFNQTNFDPPKLNQPVEKLRRALSQKLWQSTVKNDDGDDPNHSANNLFFCLDQLKDYYFLGKGELFLALIDEMDACSTKNCPLALKTLKNDDLNKLLRRSFTKLQGENFDWSRDYQIIRLEFCKNDDDQGQQNSEESTAEPWWDTLEPFLNVGKRVAPIFTAELLQSCRNIFKFLFKIRYVQTSLHRCWLKQLKSRSSSSTVLEAKIWRVNNLMVFFVNNLQFYLHVDILDSSYRNLLSNLSHQNFDEYQRAVQSVQEFVKHVSISCFLESREISKIVDGLLDSCRKFCQSILMLANEKARSSDDDEKISTGQKNHSSFIIHPPIGETVHETYIAFERRASLLFKVLSNPKMHLVNPHLSQLLQRLDMNSYFSNTSLF